MSSAPFTTISNGDDLQALSLLNELQLAYSERRQAIGQSAADLLEAGQDLQAVSLWSGWQDWVEDNVASWLDYEAGSGGDFTGLASLPVLDLARLRTLAGLPEDGFRRVPGDDWPEDWTDNEDPAFEYGPCESGDIIGPWLWVDLQRAFSALRWTTYCARAWITAYPPGATRDVTTTNASCSAAYAANVAAWTSPVWGSGGANPFAYAEVSAGWKARSWRVWRRDQMDIPVETVTSVDLYNPIGSAFGAFADLDSLGYTSGNLGRLGTLTGRQGYLDSGAHAANPLPLSSWNCSNPGQGGWIALSGDVYTVKHEFTNQGE